MGASKSRRRQKSVNITEGLQLLHAACTGDKLGIGQCMRRGAHVNIRDPQDRTPLMHAVDQGHVDCVKSLIHTWEADVNAKRQNGVTALHIACKNGSPDCVELLIQQEADVNIVDKSFNTPLIHTVTQIVTSEVLRCLTLFLQAGAHVNILGEQEGAGVNKIHNNIKNGVMAHLNEVQLLNKKVVLLLLAGGETLEDWHDTSPPCDYDDTEVLDCILYRRTPLELKRMCRDVIRNHMLKISPVNLFARAPGLGLPSVLTSYILCHVSLDLCTCSH